MADYKIVDVTQLDADLTSIANAIRAKTGGSESLIFPAAFIEAIGSISGGDGEIGDIDFYCFPKTYIYPYDFSAYSGYQISQMTSSNSDSLRVGCGEDNDWYIYTIQEGVTTITLDLYDGDAKTYVLCCIDTENLKLNNDYSRTAFTVDDYTYQTISGLTWNDWFYTSLNPNRDFYDGYNSNAGRWCVFYNGSPIYTMSGDLVDEYEYMDQAKYTTAIPTPEVIDKVLDVSVELNQTINLPLGYYTNEYGEIDYNACESKTILGVTEQKIADINRYGHADEIDISGSKIGSTIAYVQNGLGMTFQINIVVVAGNYTDTYDMLIRYDDNQWSDNSKYLSLNIPAFNSISSITYTTEGIVSISAYGNKELEIQPHGFGVTTATITFNNGIVITINFSVRPVEKTKILNDSSNTIERIIITTEQGMTWGEWLVSDYNNIGLTQNLINDQGVTIPLGFERNGIIYGVLAYEHNDMRPWLATLNITITSDDLSFSLEPFTNYIQPTSNQHIGSVIAYVGDPEISIMGMHDDIVAWSWSNITEIVYETANTDYISVRTTDVDWGVGGDETPANIWITALKPGFVKMYVKNAGGEVYVIRVFLRCRYAKTYNVEVNAGERYTVLADQDVFIDYVEYITEGIVSVEGGSANEIDIYGLRAGTTTVKAVGYIGYDTKETACFTLNISVTEDVTETITLPVSQTSVTFFADKNYNSVTLTGIDGLTDNINTIISNDGKLTINYEVDTDTEITVHCTVA